MITGGESFLWRKWKYYTTMSEQKVIKTLLTGEHPGLTSCRFFGLSCSRQHTELVQNALWEDSVSQSYTWFVWHLERTAIFQQ